MLFMPRTNNKAKTAAPTIGGRVAELRKQFGYTQSELAEELGIMQKLVSDYERGRIRIPPEVLAKLATAFEVSTDELIGVKRLKTRRPLKNRRLQLRLNRPGELSKSDQETIIRMIDSLLKKPNSA